MLTALLAAALLVPGVGAAHARGGRLRDDAPGTVAFAVRTEKDVWGRDLDRPVQSASVVKALLLVAYLRQRACATGRCAATSRSCCRR